MGTSTSSTGPGSGVSFDPPWLDQIGDGQQPNQRVPVVNTPADSNPSIVQQPILNKPIGIAPARRFANARRELGLFSRSGSKSNFQKAVGYYSRTGMGGSKNAAGRMRSSIKTVSGLVSLLQSTRSGADPQTTEWVKSLVARNPTAQDVIDEIIRRITPSGGSVDEESCHDSMNYAMSELLIIQPDVDLLNMNDGNIWTVVELFMVNEAFNRLQLDIGQLFESAKLSPRDVVLRINEMQDYLKSEISSQMQPLRESNANPDSTQLESLVQQALINTFSVYEGTL